MFLPILRALAVLALFCAGACSAQPPFGRMQEQTGALVLASGGVCSGTAVGPHVILSAAHCVDDNPVEIRFRGILYRIVGIERDANDHALIRIDGDLARWAKLGPPPRVGDVLHVIGNPGGRLQIYRQAIVGARLEHERYGTAIYLDCRCWKGDSGAALFNDRGQLVGVISAMDGEALWYMTIAFPFTFTAEQWRAASR